MTKKVSFVLKCVDPVAAHLVFQVVQVTLEQDQISDRVFFYRLHVDILLLDVGHDLVDIQCVTDRLDHNYNPFQCFRILAEPLHLDGPYLFDSHQVWVT